MKLLIWGCVAYAGLCLGVFLVQRRLMYFPDRSSEQEAQLRASRLGLTPWRDGAGRRLAGACSGPLRIWEVLQAGHNDLPLRPGPPWSEILAFLREQAGMGQ